MIELQKCQDVFEIDNIDMISVEQLQKKYRRLCLKYHPDKTLQASEDKFIEMQHAYHILLKEKEKRDLNQKRRDNEKKKSSYMEETIYDSLFSLFKIDNIEKVVNWVVDYYQHEKNTILHVTFDQVLNQEIYPYGNIYIPLWHKKISRYELLEYDEECQIPNDIFLIKIHNIPSHIQILNNNDLIVYVDIDKLKPFELNQEIYICLYEKKWVSFSAKQAIFTQPYLILHHKGIPKIKKNDPYDVSELSDVIIHFTNQTNH